MEGLEPSTSSLSVTRSNHLSYTRIYILTPYFYIKKMNKRQSFVRKRRRLEVNPRRLVLSRFPYRLNSIFPEGQGCLSWQSASIANKMPTTIAQNTPQITERREFISARVRLGIIVLIPIPNYIILCIKKQPPGRYGTSKGVGEIVSSSKVKLELQYLEHVQPDSRNLVP